MADDLIFYTNPMSRGRIVAEFAAPADRHAVGLCERAAGCGQFAPGGDA